MLPLPIHPALVHFPIAMLTAAWVCLLLFHATASEAWDDRARFLERVGVWTIPIVVVAGFVDADGLAALSPPRWDQPLVWHVLTALAAAAVFTVHWRWRRSQDRAELSGSAAIVDVSSATVGVWLLVLTGLIAGEMVYGA